MSEQSTVAFHLSLNVSDLGRAIEFYRVLFGTEPAKRHDDYAKFELTEPPVIFSLVPRPPGSGGVLSHLGFRVSAPEALAATQERLAAAGICTQDQQGTLCGYARQDKLWTRDPDGNFWEVYLVDEEVEPALVRSSLEGAAARVEPTGAPVTWEHYLTHPLAEPLPHEDGTVDEALLTGTLNGPFDAAQRAYAAAEAYRILKPGGRVVLHGLMSDAPLSGAAPELPGMAAVVSRVPDRTEAETLLRTAGFVGIQITKLTPEPWFVHEGIGLREVKLTAWKPLESECGTTRRVLYKGPLARVTADGGWVFPRGERVEVPEAVWQQLRLGEAAEQFLFLDPDQHSACSA